MWRTVILSLFLVPLFCGCRQETTDLASFEFQGSKVAIEADHSGDGSFVPLTAIVSDPRGDVLARSSVIDYANRNTLDKLSFGIVQSADGRIQGVFLREVPQEILIVYDTETKSIYPIESSGGSSQSATEKWAIELFTQLRHDRNMPKLVLRRDPSGKLLVGPLHGDRPSDQNAQ